MFLDQSSLEEFKEIIYEEYGIKLTDEQAYQDAVAFLAAFKTLIIDTQWEKDANVS